MDQDQIFVTEEYLLRNQKRYFVFGLNYLYKISTLTAEEKEDVIIVSFCYLLSRLDRISPYEHIFLACLKKTIRWRTYSLLQQKKQLLEIELTDDITNNAQQNSFTPLPTIEDLRLLIASVDCRKERIQFEQYLDYKLFDSPMPRTNAHRAKRKLKALINNEL